MSRSLRGSSLPIISMTFGLPLKRLKGLNAIWFKPVYICGILITSNHRIPSQSLPQSFADLVEVRVVLLPLREQSWIGVHLRIVVDFVYVVYALPHASLLLLRCLLLGYFNRDEEGRSQVSRHVASRRRSGSSSYKLVVASRVGRVETVGGASVASVVSH